MKIKHLLSTALILLCYHAIGANRFWISNAASNWNNTANWSTSSGGAGGASVPGLSDIAIYNNVRNGDCNIDAVVNVLGIQITGYTGAIAQNANTIAIGTSGYSQNNGTFTGGNANITITGSTFALSGGTFTSTSAILSVGGSQGSATIFTHSAGTFTHNSGTVTFNPQVPGCVAGTYTIDLLNATAFYNVIFNGTQSCGNFANINTASNDTIDAKNDLTHTDGVFNGLVEFKNNLIIGSSADGGSGTLIANGTGAQTYTVDPAAPRTAHLMVNKTAGALTPNGGTTALTLTKFTQLLGDFTAPTGNFSIGGSQSSSTIFTHTAGTFTHNSGTTIFDPAVPGCVAGAYVVDIINTTAFFNVTFNGTQSCGNLANITTAASDTIDAKNDLNHTDGVFNGLVEFKNNLIIGSSADGGSGTLIANGIGAQTYTVDPAAPRTAHLMVNKTAGALTPNGGTTALTLTKFTQLLGDFTAPTGNFSIGGSQSSSTIYTHTAGTFTHNSGTTIFDPAVPGCVAGAYVVDIINTTAFFNVTFNGTQSCGNLSNISTAANDTIDAKNDFTHTDGVFNGFVEFKNNLVINAGADGGSGTIIADGAGVQTYTVDPAAPRTAHLVVNKTAGSVTPNGGTTVLSLTKFSLLQGSFTAPTGNFSIGGSQSSSTIFTHSGGTFIHNSGTTIFDPAVPGCVAGAYVIDVQNATAFRNVIFNGTQSCGNLSNLSTAAGDTIDATNDFTHTDGVFNGFVEFKNNLIINAGADGGSGTIIADGTGAQTYTVDPTAPRTAHLVVNKTAGAVTPAGGTTVLSLTKFSLLQGSFTAPTGNFSIGGSQSSSTIFTHSGGTFIHNSGTTIFDPAVPGCVAGAYVIDVLNATAFRNVIFNGTQNCGNLSNISTAAGDTIDATNDFTHTDGVFNGFVEFKNNLIINAGADGGSGAIIANGTVAQTYTVDPTAPRTAHLVINKTAGAVTPAGGTTVLSLTKFSLLQGSFNAPTGNFSIGGSQSSSTIFTHSGGTFIHNSGTTIFEPAVPGCVAGAYVIDVLNATAFRNVIFNGTQSCGNLSNLSTAAGDTIDATNDFTHTDGVFNGFVEFKNNLTINAGADGGSGTIIADGTGAQTYTVDPTAPRTAHLVVNKTSGAVTPAGGTTVLSLTKFSLLQGSFTAPTGNFSIGGSQSSSTIFTHSGGTFIHNSGTTIFDPAVPGCVAGAYVIDLINATAFSNVTFNGTQSCGNLSNISTAAGDTIDATNDLVHTDGVFNGFAEFKRDFYVNAGADGGSGTIVADLTASQNYIVDPSAPRTAHLVVNKTANSLSPGTGTTLLSLTKFSLLQGTFIAPTGNLSIGGSQSSSTIFTHSGGTFTHNSGVTVFDPQVPGCVAGSYTIDVSTSTLFNYVTLNGSQSCGNLANITTAAGDTIDAALDLTHNDGVFNGLAGTQSNLIVNAGSDGGTGSFMFTGTINQVYTIDQTAPRSPSIVVKKPTGSVTAGVGTTNFSIRGMTIAQGSFTAPTGILNLFTGFSNSGVFNNNNATVTFAGTAVQAISGTTTTTFYNVNNSNAANVSLSQNCNIDNNLNFTSGRFVINSRKLALSVACTITGNTAAMYIQSSGLAGGLGVEKSFPTGTGNFTFPIGTSARFAPVSYNITANGAPGVITVQPVTGAHPSTTDAANTQLNFYWKVQESGFSGLAVTHVYNYIQADVNGTEASYVAGRFVNPLWTPIGGIAGTVNAGANTITLAGVNYLVGDYTAGLTAEFQNTPAVVISASPSGTICSGVNVTFTAVPTNGGVTPTYQWQVNGANVGSNSTTYSNNALADGDFVTCLMTSSIPASFPNPATSNTITMSVISTVTPTISISANLGNPVCPGSSVTFTASITDGGTTPSFQWKKNGGNVGSNSATFVLASPTNGDVITCVLTSNASCTTSATATSAGATIVTNSAVTPSVSIVASPPGGICTGTSVTFTATPFNGGAFPTYHWKLNGANVGANSTVYTNGSLANGDIVSCTLTSNATCSTPTNVNSNNITMVVGAVLAPAVSIAASPSGAICAGTSVTFTPTPTNGGGSPTYEWFLNGVSQGLSATFVSAALANGNTISAIMTSSLACAAPATATSNTINMTVNATVTPSVSISITIGTNPTCSGVSITFTATPTNGGAGPTYQWTKNGINIGGATSVTYTGVAGTDFVNGDLIRVVITSNATCPSPATATSAAITMTVNPLLTPSVIASITIGTNPACNGSSVTFTATPTNGGASPTYQWTKNGVNIGGATSVAYAGLAGTDFVSTDVIRVVMTSNVACPSPATGTSNGITMTVNPLLTPSVTMSITIGSNPACNGSSVTFTAVPTNGGTSPGYQWTKNGANIGGATSVNYTGVAGTDFVSTDVIRVVMTSNATCPSPATATSTGIIMTVTATVTPTIIISADPTSSVCSGLVFHAAITNGGGTPAYQWKKNGVNVGSNSANYAASGVSSGDLITCVLTSNATCASPNPVTSNTLVVNLTVPVTNWLGITNSWSTGGNWSNGVPNNNLSAVISSGTPFSPVISGVAETYNLTINAGATLTISGSNFIEVYGNFTNNGTFTANNSNVIFSTCGGLATNNHNITTSNATTTTFYNLTLDDVSGATLNTNANLIGTLTLSRGTFTNNNKVFSFKSTLAATARLAAVTDPTANYVGNIRMERFAPGPKTGWTQLGTPIQGATLAQWYDNFSMSGFTGVYQGSTIGGFVSIYTYNETAPGIFDAPGSYVPATNITNSITIGKGFWVYLGTATVNTANITIDVTGQPYIGNFNFNPSYTNSSNSADGFNLFANPYPSTIDWNSGSWTKTNMENAIYMYQADNGQFASFVNGISTNGGSRYIASSQGFYVQANAASPVLTITENAKTIANPVLIKETDPESLLRLVISGNDVTDETAIHLNSDATRNFDGKYDAAKLFSPDKSFPSISSIVNGKDISINSIPFEAKTISIPVRVTVGISGTYTLSWSGLDRFPEGSCIVLEDVDNGNKMDLAGNQVYYFNASEGFRDARFLIHISTPLERTTTESSCSNSKDGSITLQNPFNTSCKVQLSNDQGDLLKEVTFADATYTFNGLTSGTYKVSYPEATQCGTMVQTVKVASSQVVTANFEPSATSVFTNEKVSFKTAMEKGANLTWDFGDGYTAVNESTVEHKYATDGIYAVSLTNSKGDCSDTQSMILNVSNANTLSGNLMDVQMINGSFYAVFYFDKVNAANIAIVNALGQEIAAPKTFEGKNGSVKLDFNNAVNGVYLVTLTNGNNIVTKRVVR